MHLAIIGAGVAGLAAAYRLQRQHAGTTVTILEKSRGVGGRAATRRAHDAVFDHGAQYIKGANAEINNLLGELLPHATLADIRLPVWTFDGRGTIREGDPQQNAGPKWTYRDGIARLATELARNLDIRFATEIRRLAQANESYILFDADDTIVAAADAVLFTPPAPQTQAIIAASALPAAAQTTLLAELARATYRPCLTLTLGYPPSLRDRPFYALVNTDKQHPIAWLAYEHHKPGRDTGNQHVLIAQMAPVWSNAHWDDPLPELTEQVTALVSDLLNEDLHAQRWADRQGWRDALPNSGADFEVLNRALPGLFFAGDFTAGQGRVHLAIEQGWQVAARIVQRSHS